MKTLSAKAKPQPMILPAPSPVPEVVQPAPASRSSRTTRAAGARCAANRKKRAQARPSPITAGETFLRILRGFGQNLVAALRPLRFRRAVRRMRVMETLPLGNKQSLSLIHVDGQDLLLGVTANAVSLLAMLDSTSDRPAELTDVKNLVAGFYSKAQ